MIEDLIYDVGMNDGADTAYYLREGFRVIAIEANPRLAEKAAEQFKEDIRANRLHILNTGITAEEGELPFWICDEHPEHEAALLRRDLKTVLAHLLRDGAIG